MYPTGNEFVPTKLHCVGRIVAKEYCEAKKDDNRYKVSLGTKFYRIRAESITSDLSIDVGKRAIKRERQTSNIFYLKKKKNINSLHFLFKLKDKYLSLSLVNC